jgi:hypothetical protein
VPHHIPLFFDAAFHYNAGALDSHILTKSFLLIDMKKTAFDLMRTPLIMTSHTYGVDVTRMVVSTLKSNYTHRFPQRITFLVQC